MLQVRILALRRVGQGLALLQRDVAQTQVSALNNSDARAGKAYIYRERERMFHTSTSSTTILCCQLLMHFSDHLTPPPPTPTHPHPPPSCAIHTHAALWSTPKIRSLSTNESNCSCRRPFACSEPCCHTSSHLPAAAHAGLLIWASPALPEDDAPESEWARE